MLSDDDITGEIDLQLMDDLNDLCRKDTVDICKDPITIQQLPKTGVRLTLRDGREGYIAGLAKQSGKVIFVQQSSVFIGKNITMELWPSDFRNYKECK